MLAHARLALFPSLGLTLFVGAVAGQQPRDLSTAATRLVGHWVGQGNDRTDYYFGPLDSTTGRGSLVLVDRRPQGQTARQEYRLDKAAGAQDTVAITLIRDGRERRGADRVIVPPDGQAADWVTEIRMLRVHRRMSYVDAATAP